MDLKQIKLQSDVTKYVDSLDFKPDYINPEYKTLLAQPEVIKEMYSKGIGVNAWIPNDEAALEKLLAVGVDGVITDTPDIAHAVFEKTDAVSK